MSTARYFRSRVSAIAWLSCAVFAFVFMISQYFVVSVSFARVSADILRGQMGLSCADYPLLSEFRFARQGAGDTIHWGPLLPGLKVYKTSSGKQVYKSLALRVSLALITTVALVVALLADWLP